MTISTLTDFENARRDKVRFLYSGGSNFAANQWTSPAQLQSDPGGIPQLSNTTTGTVPVAGDAGFPVIGSSGAIAYVSRVEANMLATSSNGTCAGRVMLYDRLWHAGRFLISSTATFSLSSQPSFSARLPGGSYAGTLLLLEVENSVGGACTIQINYTNQSGVSGRTSGAVSYNVGAFYIFVVKLQVGDSGVQKVDSIAITGTGGAPSYVNLVIARPIAVFPLEPPTTLAGTDATHYAEAVVPMEALGLPQIYDTSALAFALNRSQTSNPVIELRVEVVGEAA
jgi:hypothetical protein